MKKFFLLLYFFMVTHGFSTIIDRIERLEREINEYKQVQTSEAFSKTKLSFNQENKWLYFQLYPEFLIMQVKKDAKEHGLVYIGSMLGRDWTADLKGKESLPWTWGYRLNASVNISSYDLMGSFLRYSNTVRNDGGFGLQNLSLKAADLGLGYKKSGFGIVEFKRVLGARKLFIDTEEKGELSAQQYTAFAKTRFKATGPMANLQLTLNVLGGMHLQGALGGSIVYGEAENLRFLHTASGEQVLAPLKSKSRTLIPSFDFKLGGGWDLVDEKSLLVSLSLAYQAQYYYLNHPMNNLGQSLSSLIKVDFDKNSAFLNDLTLFGTALRLEVKF